MLILKLDSCVLTCLASPIQRRGGKCRCSGQQAKQTAFKKKKRQDSPWRIMGQVHKAALLAKLLMGVFLPLNWVLVTHARWESSVHQKGTRCQLIPL